MTHPHDTGKLTPVVVHPDEFRTVIEWFPFVTLAKEVPLWYEPPSSLYSRPVPAGLAILITAFPEPRVQSIVSTGFSGDEGCVLITTPDDAEEEHPELVTIKVQVPAGKPDIVELEPVPVVVTAPGLRVSDHVPVEGKLLNATLPVATAHVGIVIVPICGVEGLLFTLNL